MTHLDLYDNDLLCCRRPAHSECSRGLTESHLSLSLSLSHTYTYKMLCFQWGCLLFLTHFLSGCHPLDCDKNYEYEWPDINPTWCCKKCHPGQFMQKRCMKDVGTECSSCGADNYRDDYNYEFKCKRCSECTKPNMEPKKPCTPTSNTECGCKSGFICNNDQCDQCVKPPPTTTKPPPTTTTKTTTTTVMPTIKPTRRTPTSFDSVWISLSLCCACVCILLLTCFILISRHTPARGWAVSASKDYCFWHPRKSSATSSECTEEEEVPMPVQEVCGGKEYPEDV